MIKRLLSFTFLLGLGLGASAQISTFPWTEDFESQATCGTSCTSTCTLTGDFTNDTGDDKDWAADNNGTSSGSTGPEIDHNPGTSSGIYLYMEASTCYSQTANLVSPYFDFTSVNVPYLRFWYHMYGQAMGTMHLDIDTSGNWENDYITSWTDDVDEWQEQLVSLVELGGLNNVRFRIRGITGTQFYSDMAVDDFTVSDTNFSVLSDVSPPLCHGGSNGMISVSGIFGLEPFTYQWSNNATTATISNLPEGTYTVTITDDNGNTATESYVFDAPEIITTQTVLQNIACKYDNGAAKVTATGGTPITESYLVDTNSANYNPDSSQIGTLVSLGDDAVSPALPIGFDFEFFGNTFDEFYIGSNGFVSFDAVGTSYEETFPDPSVPNNVIAMVWEDLDPNSGLDGTVSYYVTGTAPLRVLHVNFIDVPYWLGAVGDVTVQLKLFETSNCIEIHTTYAGFSSSATEQTQGIENSTGTEAYWYPGRNGETWETENSFVSFCVPQGGFTYLWPDGVTDTVNNVLDPGTHIVTVADANGCEAYDTVTIDQPVSNLDLVPSIEHISCFGFADGAINSNESGGLAPVTFAWSDNQMTSNATELEAGTYGVTATDGIGCVDSVNNLTVQEPDLLVATIFNVISPNCPADETGSASVAAGGGRTPYTYLWNDGQTSASATNLSEGPYQVTVTDSSECQSVKSVSIIADNDAPDVYLGTDIYDQSGAAVTLTAGNHNSVLWSTNETTPTILVTTTGTYWAQATNAAGCMSSDTIFVEIWPTGLDNIADQKAGISLFPNPTNGALSMTLNADNRLSDVNLTITDVRGVVVQQQYFSSISPNQTVGLDVNVLSNGIYNLSVESASLKTDQRFVKQ